MSRFGLMAAIAGVVATPGLAQAGLHYTGEPIAELPSQWRGFLSDMRALRSVAVKAGPGIVAHPLRQQYEEEAKKLQAAVKERKLTSDEFADLGALLIRLGDIDAALALLRTGDREHPGNFRITSNLGTAWQLAGDLERAADTLRQAARLAPGKFQKAEELQLKLVRARMRQERNSSDIDDLFGVRFVGESGKFEPGKLAAAERKKLPSDAVALTQQLALWLPHDGKVLWLIGELANAHGDVKTAADIFESCVGQFGMSAPALREHRLIARDAVAKLDKTPPGSDIARTEHAGHAGLVMPKSRRPLAAKRYDLASLPPISKDGVNPLPWGLVLETSLDRNYRPAFPKYLQELAGNRVSLTGYIQPLTDELESSAFMLIEYPTGCWFCEMPEITGIVLIELPDGKSAGFTRSQVKVTGLLTLNATDPENFLYILKGAKVVESD